MGGGWTFVSNFRKTAEKLGHTFVDVEGMAEADLVFVPNPMWAERKDFEDAHYRSKPIVLRLDNIPEDWNNRGTAISKLKDFINRSDTIIYQSQWSQDKYIEFAASNDLKVIPSTVIHNGVDTDMFSPTGVNMRSNFYPRILFVKSSRNENKRYPEGMEIFRRYFQKNRKSKLFLLGQFADDYHHYNFGFYNGENIQYLGVQSLENMPAIYRSVDILLFPAYADCAPNVLLEAMACGVIPIIHPYGGGVEFIDNGRLGVLIGETTNYQDLIDQALAIKPEDVREYIVENFSLVTMVDNYLEIFSNFVE